LLYFLRRIFQVVQLSRRETSQVGWLVLVVFGLIAFGAGGFYYFEGVHAGNDDLTVGDALWWSIVTMTTVGYGDYFAETWQGRWLISVPVMLLGIGVLGYAIGILTTIVIERHNRELKGMVPYKGHDHVIVCNHPSAELVLEVVEEIRADRAWADRDVVLLTDAIDELSDDLRAAGVHFVKGPPSREACLKHAGVERAKSVMVLASGKTPDESDNLNLGVVVTVRALREDVDVVVECSSGENRKLLRNAGATEIVTLGELGAELMVQGLQDPGVNDVLADLVSNKKGHQIYVERIKGFAGTFGELERRIEGKGRYAVLGLMEKDGTPTFLPDRDRKVAAGEKLLLIGDVRLDGV